MKHPEISIGIAFRNASPFIEVMVKSLLCQTWCDWEAIMIDDASTDESLSIVSAFADRRFTIIHGDRQAGAQVRRNQAVAAASGRYFAIMDADDVMHPDRLSREYEVLAAADETTVVGGGAYAIDNNSKVVGKLREDKHAQAGFGLRHSFINPTVMAHTSWFRQNPWSTKAIFQRAQDAELWCRSAKRSKFIHLSEPLVFYRQPPELKLPEEIGTSLALIEVLYEQFPRPRLPFAWHATMTLLKLAAGMVGERLGQSRAAASRRVAPLDAGERARAQAVLEAIITSGSGPRSRAAQSVDPRSLAAQG